MAGKEWNDYVLFFSDEFSDPDDRIGWLYFGFWNHHLQGSPRCKSMVTKQSVSCIECGGDCGCKTSGFFLFQWSWQ